MAKQAEEGAKKPAAGAKKPDGGAKKADGGAKKAGAAAKKAEAPDANAAAVKEKEAKPAPTRAPADPRLKLLKKFHGKFLPKGVLRERHKAIMARWNSGEDHGGVTVAELKTLLDDWRGTREKPPRMPTA